MTRRKPTKRRRTGRRSKEVRSGRRRIIVFIAVSADGFIARPDGGIEWLNRPAVKGNYDMGAFMKSVDTVVWGKRTYDESLTRGGVDPFGMRMQNFVFTHRIPGEPVPGVQFINEPVESFVERLREKPGKDIWMMGGGGIIASFLDAGAIDEFIIHVIPTFIGEGIPLIRPHQRNVPLHLRSVKTYADGVVRLQYDVEHVVSKT